LKRKVDSTDFVFFNIEKFFIELHALYCRPTPPQPGELIDVFQSRVPGIEKPYLAKWPTREAHQAELLRRIDKALAELRAREESLRTGPEAAQKALAADQALIPQDLPEGRYWVRYFSEHKSTYFRATNELRLLQAREAEDDVDVADAEEPPQDEEVAHEAVPAEANPTSEEVSEAACEADFPNDPKVPNSESQNAVAQVTCGTHSGLNTELPSRAWKHTFGTQEAA
jgi:hypothetical protein